jgi:hypothetical protein
VELDWQGFKALLFRNYLVVWNLIWCERSKLWFYKVCDFYTNNEGGGGCVMVFNATFNNISVISWRSVLLVEDNGVHKENHRPVASHWQTIHIIMHQIYLTMSRIQTHNFSGDRHWLHR